MSISKHAFNAILGVSPGPASYQGPLATPERMAALVDRLVSDFYLSAIVRIAKRWADIQDGDDLETLRVAGCLDSQGFRPHGWTPRDWHTPEAHRARAKFAVLAMQSRVDANADAEATTDDVSHVVELLADADVREGKHWGQETYRQAAYARLIAIAESDIGEASP